jgi:Ca2+/Na+ antiporter
MSSSDIFLFFTLESMLVSVVIVSLGNDFPRSTVQFTEEKQFTFSFGCSLGGKCVRFKIFIEMPRISSIFMIIADTFHKKLRIVVAIISSHERYVRAVTTGGVYFHCGTTKL